MASLETLPAPIPLHITKHLADLKSLQALRLSSPLFAAVFALHATEIFEHAMLRSLCEEVIVELRAYIHLLTRRPKGQSLPNEDLQSIYSAAQEPLGRETPSSVIGYTLKVFATLCTACIAVFHEKLRRLYSLPRHRLADLSKASQLGERKDNLHLQPARQYIPPPASPMDWDEQQRLLRAILRLRIWKAAGNSSGFPATDYPAFTWIRRATSHYEALIDEMQEMAASLDEGSSFEDITRESLIPKPVAEAKAQLQKAKQDDVFPVGESYGYSYFNKALKRWPMSPLRGDADWKVMRALGVGIWSCRRLRELRLRERHSLFRNLSPEEAREKVREVLGQVESVPEGEDLDQRDILFTWNALYRTAAGESIHTANPRIARTDDE